MSKLEKLELKLREAVRDRDNCRSSIEHDLDRLCSLGQEVIVSIREKIKVSEAPAESAMTLADMALITEGTYISLQNERVRTPVRMADLGKVLLRERTDRALTLRELGGQIGVSASTLSRIENNAVAPPSVPTLKAISRWLDLSIEIDGVTDCPDPWCEYCLGTGERYTHSPDCDDDNCALAVSYHDCQGIIEKCGCGGNDES